MKLFYFGYQGRAETARLLFNLADVKFENVTFDYQQWGEKYKALSPSGHAPWLELDDGSVLAQSSAINMYAAGLAGLQPPNSYQLARTIELVDLLEDVFTPYLPSLNIEDKEEQAAFRKALVQPDGAMTVKFMVAERMIADVKTEYYCGDQTTLADYHLFAWLGFVRTDFVEGVSIEYLESFKKMSALRSKVASLPKVKEMYGSMQGFEP